MLLTAGTLTESDRSAAALLFAGEGATLSGAAALRASGVAKIAAPGSVLVLVPPGNRTTSSGWVQVRQSARPLILENWHGPCRVHVARATADLALTMKRLDDVRALVAKVVQHGHATVEEIGKELEAGPRNRSALLRQALRDVGYGAASAPEARSASLLRRAGLRGFRQNARIDLPGGGYYLADFLWEELRAILEIDSREYHFEAGEWESTMDRHLALTTLGYSVIHRAPSALRNQAKFVADVRCWLDARRAGLW